MPSSEKPKLAVFAPAAVGRITKVTGLIPRTLGSKIMTASGSDHLLLDSQRSEGRRAYEARVAASAPGAEQARAGQ